jgi:NitT/TauT family transport system permease protein
MTTRNAVPADSLGPALSASRAGSATKVGLSRNLQRRLFSVLLLAALLLLWEGAVVAFGISALMFPAPSAIAMALWRGLASGLYWEHIGVTGFEMLAGLAIGTSCGFVFGVLISEFPQTGRILFPYLVSIQSLPKVAIAPLIIMWFGFGIESKLVVVALITFFPILINTLSGLSIIDEQRMDLMRVLLANRWQTFLYVRLPSAAPTIFAGLNVAIVLALTGAIVAEFVGAQRGLGVLLVQSQTNLDTAGMFAILVLLAAIGLTANVSIRRLEKVVLYWAKRRETN